MKFDLLYRLTALSIRQSFQKVNKHRSYPNIRFYSIMSTVKPQIVFVLGAPGSGKGTQCSKICDRFGYVHLSAGDLLREERQRPGSEFGEMIEERITEGKIVPVEVTCSLIEKAMKLSGKDKFLIDGFPRNEDNLTGWNRQMADRVTLKFVLFFDCDEPTCTERCLKRGAAGSGRTDDNVESLKKRFHTFYNDSLPIVKHYDAINLVKKVDGSKDPDTIFEAVQALFSQ